jgi:hypothetical protein
VRLLFLGKASSRGPSEYAWTLLTNVYLTRLARIKAVYYIRIFYLLGVFWLAIRPVVLGGNQTSEEVLNLGTPSSSLSAKFIRNNKLEDMESIQFLMDDENPFWLGFKFFKDKGPAGSLALGKSKDSATTRFTSTGLVNGNPLLTAITRKTDAQSKTFSIQFDKRNDCWFIELRPSFERAFLFKDKGTIPYEAKGIYRYLGIKGDLLYIGKGAVRDRLESPERREWGIHTIEYSILESDELALQWESHYISDHVQRFGVLPPLNRVKGHSQG